MANSGHKAAFLRDVEHHCKRLVELIEDLEPLLETATSAADAAVEVAAAEAHTRLLVLRGAAQRALYALERTD